jgi:tRNA pseudouridine55 synthase
MFLLVDKPKGITSHDVVDRVRRVTGERRVGHGGTLDPNATGLLIVGVGRQFTKKLGEISQNTKKTYEAEIFLGEVRDTDDSEGKIVGGNSTIRPSEKEVKEVVESFIGEQEQIPPQYSAIKQQGKKAYELARKGTEVTMEPRQIIIYSIEFETYEWPVLEITCEVSSGTYIRALARDIGEKLGTGAYLRELRRTHIGEFDISEAVNLEDLQKQYDNLRNKEH